jgi:hypothetical protein
LVIGSLLAGYTMTPTHTSQASTHSPEDPASVPSAPAPDDGLKTWQMVLGILGALACLLVGLVVVAVIAAARSDERYPWLPRL